MSSYDLDILVRKSGADGFAVTRSLHKQIRQKLIILFMTMPSERLMNPDFGVGLQTFLFEAREESTGSISSNITNKIMQQTARYMPYINIENIEYNFPEDSNTMGMRVSYSVPSIAEMTNPETGEIVIDYVNFILEGNDVNIAFDDHIDASGSNSIYSRASMVGSY